MNYLQKYNILLFALVAFTCNTFANSPEEIFKIANKAYEKGDYKSAIENYENILKQGLESSVLYYNLGNAYYKTDEIGRAILNYERAKILTPGDDDVEYNIKLTQQKIEDKIDDSPQLFISQWIKWFSNIMSEKQWSILCIVTFVLGLLLLAIYYVSKNLNIRKLSFYNAWIFIAIAFFTFFIARFAYMERVNSKLAVITAKSVHVMSTPGDNSKKLFLLHEGTKVTITGSDNDWLEIKISNGNVGWLKDTELEKI